jgi:hypothetical protein
MPGVVALTATMAGGYESSLDACTSCVLRSVPAQHSVRKPELPIVSSAVSCIGRPWYRGVKHAWAHPLSFVRNTRSVVNDISAQRPASGEERASCSGTYLRRPLHCRTCVMR